jgi:hypothetical protein
MGIDMKFVALLLSSTLIVSSLCAQEPVPVPVAPSVQQRFDAAEKLLAADQHAPALAAFIALEADLLKSAKPKLLSISLVRSRKSKALARLGRIAEAKEAIIAALASGALNNEAMDAERNTAQEFLARLYSEELDDAAAATEYEALIARVPNPGLKASYLLGLSRAMFILDPKRALAAADKALAIVRSDETEKTTEAGKKVIAVIQNFRGRSLLNLGNIPEARSAFQQAITLRGGLDLNIDHTEYASRSDAAIAALRAGDTEAARKLLSYTGAGRTKAAFPRGIDNTLPQCGGLDGLKPEDSAVVQFALAKTGAVTSAIPVFASRSGPMAYAFARAIKEWTWTPDSIANVEPFFLSNLRVEVRCSNTFSRPNLNDDLNNRVISWLVEKGAKDIPASGLNFGALTAESAQLRLDRAIASGDKLDEAIGSRILALSPATGRDRATALNRRSIYLLREAGAPAAVWLGMEVSAQTFSNYQKSAKERAGQLAMLRADPALIADRQAMAMLNLTLAELYAFARQPAQEAEVLNAVIKDAEIDVNDPLRTSALIALANLAIVKGDVTAAQQAYAQTGLDARQCAVLDAKPVLLRTNVSYSDYPKEVLRWGFEGWTRQEYDISATGKTENIRTVIAFPPGVFVAASENMAKKISYRPSFRPQGGLGCGGVGQGINFRLP